jgi:hypothetical protein
MRSKNSAGILVRLKLPNENLRVPIKVKGVGISTRNIKK